MRYTYEEFPIEGKEKLRDAILKLFGRDIATVSCSFSSRNYAFIFAEGSFPAVIRIGIQTPYRTTEDVLCEIMFIDDLRNDVPTVCQPIPSLGNRLVEQVTVGEQTYLLTMFRKANGASLKVQDGDKQYCYRVGALLGRIHRTSCESATRGFRYKRKNWDEFPYFNFSYLEGHVPEQTKLYVDEIKKKIDIIPQDPRWHGMIHGDFVDCNIFNDWDTVWAFDFDDSCYGYFMFDIVTFVVGACFIDLDSPAFPKNFEEFIYGSQGIYTQIRKGYESEWKLPEEQWDLMDDFVRLRFSEMLTMIIIEPIIPLNILDVMFKAIEMCLKPGPRPILRIPEVMKYLKNTLKPEEYTFLFAE